ncbi:MAG: amidohydrolase family protein [Flavobacteriales bacterium]|nr:amidohydrolase family protein [Flavobacteriales bacterium]MCB9175355.1 amidohydrolase family protein [Flavobacteriales bacterium]
MLQISANYIFPGNSTPIKNGVVVLDDKNIVLEVLDPKTTPINWENVRIYEGIVCPGFVNTHCHLELSYLKGKVKEQTKLHGFIKDIISIRESFSDDVRLEAITAAEQEMKQNGIVAVGDISNGTSTFKLKATENLYYHTFVEVFGSDPSIANDAFNHAKRVYDTYFDKKKASITPHATYSVSDKLTQLVNQHCKENNSLVSIHNQETESENHFYQHGKGDLFDFLNIREKLKGEFVPTQQNALPSFLGKYENLRKTLLVHNTFTNKQDIAWANNFSKNIYWAFCPNANLYIENRQPSYNLFLNEKCTIGTDSLASNWSLSILDELKTISRNSPEIPLQTLIKWATINGADFLGINHQFGSIKKGKKPGLNLISTIDLKSLKLLDNSTIKVIA